MSPSESPVAEQVSGRLVVDAPAGVETRVMRGISDEIASAVGPVDLRLTPGIYNIRWNTAGAISQSVVRLKGTDEPLEVAYEPPSTPLAGEGASSPLSAWEDAGAILASSGPLEPGRARLCLRIAGLGRDAPETIARGFRLIRADPTLDPDGRGRAPQSTSVRDRFRLIHRDEVADCAYIEVDSVPGSRVLKYSSIDRETVEQTVQLLPGRTTVGFLTATRDARPEIRDGRAALRPRRGINPAATLFVSISADGAAGQPATAEAVRMAGVLLYWLGRPAGAPAGAASAPVLAFETDDPYLALYAAALTLRPGPTGAVDGDAVARVTPSVELLKRHEGWPDAACVLQRLRFLGVDVGSGASRLTGLPMLEICWRWTAAASIRGELDGALDRRAVAAASASDIRSSPWLVWRSRFAVPRKVVETSSNALHTTASHLASRLDELVGGGRWNDLADQVASAGSQLDISGLSSGTRQIGRAMLKIADSSSWSGMGPELLGTLAASFGAPASVLAGHLAAALGEVSRVVERSAPDGAMDPSPAGNRAGPSGLDPDGDASVDGSPEAALYRSDPLKGRYGGSPERAGGRLLLERFESSNDPNALALTLAVSGLSPTDAPSAAVTFHLHPTFNPAVEVVRVIDGTASFVCYATGAFTVGAVIPDGTALELDLAQDDRLPDWFRRR